MVSGLSGKLDTLKQYGLFACVELIGWEILAVLVLVAFVAGCVDSIAGGGGLIAMPALLWAGLGPVEALATNKLQGSWGTLSATVNFYRQGQLELCSMRLAIVCTFLGSATGTLIVQRIEAGFVALLIPVLLVGAALYFLMQPSIGEADRQERISRPLFATVIGGGIGFYDGFFGPGTGSFFALAFVSLLGFNLVKATAHTKLLNFTSNLASLIFFVLGGKVVWVVGLSMAVGQFAGGWVGSHLTMKHGSRFVRPVLVTVSLVMTAKLVLERLL
jgi:uncharacterized membrane protein YfcA